MDWRIHPHRDGYVMFPGLCPQPIVRAARAAIDQDLATNYDAHRQLEYDNLGSRDIEQRRWHLMTHIGDGWETAGISPT